MYFLCLRIQGSKAGDDVGWLVTHTLTLQTGMVCMAMSPEGSEQSPDPQDQIVAKDPTHPWRPSHFSHTICAAFQVSRSKWL